MKHGERSVSDCIKWLQSNHLNIERTKECLAQNRPTWLVNSNYKESVLKEALQILGVQS